MAKKRHRQGPPAQGIIPDDVLRKIQEQAPTIEQRNAARRTLAITKRLEAKRKQAVEPQQGEKREVYDSQNTPNQGSKVRGEDDPDTGDETVDALYDDSGRWFKALFEKYGRLSYDGKGAKLQIVAHFEDKFDNAYWDGEGIWIGDGFYFKPFYLARTVTLHEWTHALTEKTLALVYSRQSGALNEFLSDAWAASIEQAILGQSVEQADWLIGRELFGGQVQGRGLRDMVGLEPAYDDPIIGKDPQTKHMKDYYAGSQDNYGVHINSGIPNRAFALAAIQRGGAAVDTLLPVVADVMLKGRVGPQATFQDFANAMRVSAVDLFGVGDPTVAAIEYGWHEVGITVGDAPPPEPPVPDSPCELSDAELLSLLRDPAVVKLAMAAAVHPAARRFIAMARAQTKTPQTTWRK